MQAPHRPASRSDAPDLVMLAKRKGFTPTRCRALSHELPTAVSSLWRRRAWEIPEGHVDDYVKLGWMDWNSGALVLTSSGQAVHDRVVAQRTVP
ncbi:MAG TPA: hypothetical protein VFP68_10230 [Burkholderiaceae bacterium]|nr:hypothetical protein [Burkholderiaceae bacterium]